MGNLFRIVAVIAVEEHDNISVADLSHTTQAGTTIAAVVLTNYTGSAGASDFCSSVGRAVVYHNYVLY